MTQQVANSPFVITPPADLLETYPQLRQAAHALALSYAHNELVTDERLQSIGSALWQALDVAEDFGRAHQYVGNKVLPIIVESDDPAIQNLPWEVLYHPEQGFLSRETGFCLSRRIPLLEMEASELQQGPLRVLLFSALPDDLGGERGRLAVEEEQEFVLEALMAPVTTGHVTLQMPDDGRFATFKQQLKEFQPHMVFLSGHGKFHHTPHDDSKPYGSFMFEDEQGFSEAVNGKVLAEAFKGSTVQCVVLSACESGKAASEDLNHGLARRLTEQRLPHVVGMRESILDRAGILFAQHFCEAIGNQERVDVALQQARAAITQPLKDATYRDSDKSGVTELSLGQWSLPTLYSDNAAAPLINWQFTPQPPRIDLKNTRLKGVTLPEKFRGRRKELRQLVGCLAKGELRQLLITGPGGQGKTALAGKLALGLQQQGWEVVAWSAKEDQSWHSFLFDLQLKLNDENRQRYDRVLAQIENSADQMHHLLAMLLSQTQGRLLLFLDNLESLQDDQSRAFTDDAVAAMISGARRLSNEGVTLLLTSRWLLPDWLSDQAQSCHWPLDHLTYGDFLQLCLLKNQQLKPLAQRRQRLRQIYQVLNGNGRGLLFFAAAVQGKTLDQEEVFLEKLAQAEGEVQTDMALHEILSQRGEAQLALLRRLQCYESPVPIEGVMKLAAGLPEPNALLSELVAFSLVEQSYHPYWLANEYHCPELVAGALNDRRKHPPADQYAQLAADYQAWLFHNERFTLSQAQVVHHAYHRADRKTEADRFALDYIVGALNRAGLYQTLLNEWLPPICQAQDEQTRAEALGQTGKQHLHIGQYETALSYLKQSLAIRQEIGDKSVEGATLNNIAGIFRARGDYEMALSYLKQSLAITQEIGDKPGEGTTLNNIAVIFRARGDYETALSYLKQSLAIQQEIGDVAGLCLTLFNLGHIHLQNGEQEEALSAWVTVYRLATQMNLAQVLEALEKLAGQLGLEGGLDAWAALAQKKEEKETVEE